MSTTPNDLGLTASTTTAASTQGDSAQGGCCGGGCCGGGAAEAAPVTGTANATTYRVAGMTCGHCVASVTEELSALPGIDAVDVTLNPEGASTVSITGADANNAEAVNDAIERAGYTLA